MDHQIFINWSFLYLKQYFQSRNLRISNTESSKTLNHLARRVNLAKLVRLAKRLSVYLRTKWLWAQIPLLSLANQIF